MKSNEFDMHDIDAKQEIYDNFWDDFSISKNVQKKRNGTESNLILDSSVTDEELDDVLDSISSNDRFQEKDKFIFDKEPYKQEVSISQDMAESENSSIILNQKDNFLEEETKLLELLLQTLEQLEEQSSSSKVMEDSLQSGDFSTQEITEYALTNNLISNEMMLNVAQELLEAGKIKIDELALVLLNSGSVTLDKIAKILYEIDTLNEEQLINYLMSNDVISKREIAEILYTNNKINDEEIINEMSKIVYDLTQSKVLQSEKSNLAIDFVENFYKMHNESKSFVDFELMFYNYFKTEIKNIIVQLNQETYNMKHNLSQQVRENSNLKIENDRLEKLIKQYITDNQEANELLALTNKKNEAIMQELFKVQESYTRQKTLLSILEKRLLKDS